MKTRTFHMAQRTYRQLRREEAERAAWRAARWVAAVMTAALALLLLAGAARAGEFDARTVAWSPRSSGLLTLAAYAAIDYDQSAGAFFGEGRGRFREVNPLLGPAPSRGTLLAFGAAGLGLAWLAGELLPEPWAAVALDSALTSERWNVEDNALLAEGRRRRIDAIPVIVTVRW